MRSRVWVAVVLVGLASRGASAEGGEPATEPKAETDVGSYPLDAIPRVLEPGQALPCGSARLVAYRGERMRLAKTRHVDPAFVPKLEGLEALVEATALEVYGRSPRQLVHLGTQACRHMRRYPDWVSEHALGNAIDVAGFDFGPLPRGQALPAGLPPALRRAFSVRVDAHWSGSRGPSAVHARFLRTLAQRLIERPDLFRCVLGPAYPGHHDHLHLDFAPYRVVAVF